MPDPDPWLGTRVLCPETINREAGRAGRRATYVIEPAPGGGYQFMLDAEDADRNPVQGESHAIEMDPRFRSLSCAPAPMARSAATATGTGGACHNP